jgi:phage/plasmid-like protein (TIGR03299 family)
MSHEIDTTNGQSSFVSAREDAWHQLGVTLPDTFTAEEAMTHGLLGGWNVRKTPLQAVAETGELLEVPGKYATMRSNPVTGAPEVLGAVGKSYHVIQNEEHAGLLNALVEESGAHFETAGAINGGRRVFITMKLPGHLSIGGVDQVDNYIAAINSHDGSMAFTLVVTPIRIVCQNTLNVALASAKRTFRIRHTRGASSLIHSEARQALDLTFNYIDGFQEAANQLINTTVTDAQFAKIITEAWGAGEDAPKSTTTRKENKLDEIQDLFMSAYTQEGIRNTAWAGFNAITEWSDHFAPTRGDDRDTSRAVTAALGTSFKDRAMELMLATV